MALALKKVGRFCLILMSVDDRDAAVTTKIYCRMNRVRGLRNCLK